MMVVFSSLCHSKISTCVPSTAERNEENLQFWLAAEEYKRLSDEAKRLEFAKTLWNDYISAKSTYTLNIPQEHRNSVDAVVSEGKAPLDLLDTVEHGIVKLMATDSWPRFLKSQHYQDFLTTSRPESRAQDPVSNLVGILRRKSKVLGFSRHKKPSKTDMQKLTELAKGLKESAVKEGYLMKRGDHHKTWHRRWFALDKRMLGYFENSLDLKLKGAILMHEITKIEANMDEELQLPFAFGLQTPERTYCIQANSERDRKWWVAALSLRCTRSGAIAKLAAAATFMGKLRRAQSRSMGGEKEVEEQ